MRARSYTSLSGFGRAAQVSLARIGFNRCNSGTGPTPPIELMENQLRIRGERTLERLFEAAV